MYLSCYVLSLCFLLMAWIVILKLTVLNSLLFYGRAEQKFKIITKLLIQDELNPAVSVLFVSSQEQLPS